MPRSTWMIPCLEKTLDLGFWDSASEPDHGKERGCKEEPKDKDS